MAHPICDAMDRKEGKEAIPCNSECENWKFPHLDTACVLSEVYSVKKGKPCYIFEQKNQKKG